MGGWKEECYSNIIEKDNILIRIEKLRDELHTIVNETRGSDNKVITKSQELDKLLNEYYIDKTISIGNSD